LFIFTYFDGSIFKIDTFLGAIYFFKSIIIEPLISHIFKITNHRSIFLASIDSYSNVDFNELFVLRAGSGGWGGGCVVAKVRKGRKYIGRDPVFFGLVLLCSITPLSSTCKSRLYLIYGEKKDLERGKESAATAGGNWSQIRRQ
jgi:hypothetical protein